MRGSRERRGSDARYQKLTARVLPRETKPPEVILAGRGISKRAPSRRSRRRRAPQSKHASRPALAWWSRFGGQFDGRRSGVMPVTSRVDVTSEKAHFQRRILSHRSHATGCYRAKPVRAQASSTAKSLSATGRAFRSLTYCATTAGSSLRQRCSTYWSLTRKT